MRPEDATGPAQALRLFAQQEERRAVRKGDITPAIEAAIASASRLERERCMRVLLRHVIECSNAQCCDNCSCLAVKKTIAELQGQQS